MNIGLIGYFGAGAYSDDLIEYVTKQLFLDVNPDITFDSTILSRGPAGSDPSYLNSFDLLVHCGGSFLGKCTYYPVANIYHWHDKVETPLAIFGAGYRYEPDKEPLTPNQRIKLNLLFAKSEVTTLRGHRTMHHLKQNGIDTSKVSSLGDPVMACPLRLNTNPKHIVGNVRNMPEIEIQHATTTRVQSLMAECYDWLIDYYHKPLTLISFRHNIVDDNDYKGAEKTRTLMRNKASVTIIKPNGFREAVGHMSEACFWFGQRLHPTMFAAVQGIPFVGLEYQFGKLLDWYSTVGLTDCVHTDNAILEGFKEVFYKSEESTERLKGILPTRITEIRRAVDDIMRLV